MPLDDLVRVIETLQQRITSYGHSFNETQTRVALIDPLLTALGWDVSDPGIVTPEYRTDVGWADYALRGPGNKPAAVVEAKRLGSFVENHLDQAVSYCIQQGIAYAAVTDGSHWQMYRTFDPLPLAEKCVLDVQIGKMAAYECALKFLLLWQPNLESGQPTNANEPILTQSQETTEGPTSSATMALPRTGEPVLTSLEGWCSLLEFKVQTGTTPPVEIRFPDGNQKPIAYWRHVEERTVEWLWQKGLLDLSHLPVPSSKKRNIVNSSAQHPTGDAFKHSVNVSGTPLVIEGNISSIASYRYTIRLLEHCGQIAA